MALIYSSFSQNARRPLPGLTKEFTELLAFFNKRKIKGLVDFEPRYGAKVSELTSELLDHQNDLHLFHFSGHSDHSGLDFPEEDFETEQLIRFFNTLNSGASNLECAVLNGCSNAEIVKRLSGVPVVIGTRSPILDQHAIKFTKDFFTALISGKNTYKKAFDQACDALPDATKDNTGVFRSLDLRESSSLKDYFIIINDDKVANGKFPLRRSVGSRTLSWVAYLAILLTLVMGVIGFMNWENINCKFLGKCCPEWRDKQKCKILIAGFNKDDANMFISDGINDNPEVNTILEAKYRHSLQQLLEDNGVEKAELPDHCDFDYLLTGGVVTDESSINIQLIPYGTLGRNHLGEEIPIGNLLNLKDSILKIDDINNDPFLISRLCTECSQKYPASRLVAEKEIEKLRDIPSYEKEYQELNGRMAAIYLHHPDPDTTNAIHSLSRIASKDINDKTLAALEEKSRLEIATHAFREAYGTQSNYIGAVEARQRAPGQYDMQAPMPQYESARRTFYLRRADLVVDHPDQFNASYEKQALADLQLLQKLENDPNLHQEKIDKLCESLGANCNDDVSDEPALLKIRTRDGEVIAGAIALFENRKYVANSNGIITLPCQGNACLGKEVQISAEGFQSRVEAISRVPEGMRIYLGEDPVVQNQAYKISGTIADCKFSNTVSDHILINGEKVPITGKRSYSYQLEAEPGQKVDIQAKSGLQLAASSKTSFVLGDQKDISIDLRLREDKPQKVKVIGKVLSRGEPFMGANIRVKGTATGAVADIDGGFTFMVEGYLCQVLTVDAGGNPGQDFELRNFTVNNNQMAVTLNLR